MDNLINNKIRLIINIYSKFTPDQRMWEDLFTEIKSIIIEHDVDLLAKLTIEKKPMPKPDYSSFVNHDVGYENGWNACVDELERRKKEIE